MSKPKRKTLGERVAEKWYIKGPTYRIELARLIDREAKKMQAEELDEGKKRYLERMERVRRWNEEPYRSWVSDFFMFPEARASVALDKHPDGQTHCELPEPKKRRKR